MATFLGFNFIFGAKPSTWMDAGLMCMFYALYYGVMARDFAEICSEKMAANIGNTSPMCSFSLNTDPPQI